MIITPESTLNDINCDFQKIFPFLRLVFAPGFEEQNNDPLDGPITVEAAGGVRLKKSENLDINPAMTMEDLQTLIFTEFGLKAAISFSFTEGERNIFAQDDADMPLKELNDLVSEKGARERPAPYPQDETRAATRAEEYSLQHQETEESEGKRPFWKTAILVLLGAAIVFIARSFFSGK